jgi:hypothetical protein
MLARFELCNPILAAALDDADALTQRDTLARPSLAGRLVGGPRYDQVVDVGGCFTTLSLSASERSMR